MNRTHRSRKARRLLTFWVLLLCLAALALPLAAQTSFGTIVGNSRPPRSYNGTEDDHQRRTS